MSTFKAKITSVSKSISTSLHAANGHCMESMGQLKSRLKTYFASKDFEIDQDSFIDVIHAHTSKRPHFEFAHDLKDRIKQKREYVLKQSALLVGAAALHGAWFAIETKNLAMTGEYALIVASGIILIFVISGTRIIIKRVLKDYDMEISETVNGLSLRFSN